MTGVTAATAAGRFPPVNGAEIETFVTDPIAIGTRLGGIVSDMALEVASKAASSPGCEPRRCISGNSTGATAAISAAFDPEMPDQLDEALLVQVFAGRQQDLRHERDRHKGGERGNQRATCGGAQLATW
jgi:hypothetical protein